MGGRRAGRNRIAVRLTEWSFTALPILAVLAACGASPGAAGVAGQGVGISAARKLTAPQPVAYELLGHSVAIAESFVAVGSLGSADPASEGGRVHIFDLPAAAEAEPEVLTLAAEPDARFGHALATAGSRLAVGAPFDGVDGDRSGAVYLFEKVAGEWRSEVRLVAGEPVPGEQFGSALAFDGATLAVGAAGPGGPAVYLFEASDDDWVQVERIAVKTDRRFGTSLELDGGWLAVGEWSESESGSGAVHLYRRSDQGWVRVQDLESPEEGDRFGSAVAMQDGMLVVGAPAAGAGRAYLYRLEGESWRLESELPVPTGVRTGFGRSVGTDGVTVAVAATTGANGNGSIELYRRQDGEWSHTLTVEEAEAGAGTSFATALDLAYGKLLVGASGDAEGGPSAGAAHIYDIRAGGGLE